MIKITGNIPIKKTKEEIDFYLENGPKFGKILKELERYIKNHPNVRSLDLNKLFRSTCESVFNKYYPIYPFENQLDSSNFRFNNSICISVDNCITHGKNEISSGDYYDVNHWNTLSIDCGVSLFVNKKYSNQRLNFDAAFTISKNNDNWWKSPLEALKRIKDNNPRNTYELASIIEQTADSYNVNQVLALTGHGIGRELHEAPIIHNATGSYRPVNFFEGIVFCAEPIFTERLDDKSKIEDVYIGDDGWSIYTQSGAFGTHFETMFMQVDNKLIDILNITELF